MKKDKIKINTIIYTTLIKGYSRKRKLDDALETFAQMKLSKFSRPNQITYNCIINACIKSDQIQKANDIFEEMKQNNFKPDLITYSTLIKGFCSKRDIVGA